jgi:dihydrofolate reductase
MHKFTIIAACDASRGIGYRGSLPWHVPADLKHFKACTVGKNVLVGATTFRGTGPLKNRTWYVLTRDPSSIAAGDNVIVITDVSQLPEGQRYIVAGGASVYEQLLPLADTILLSLIPGTHPVDTWFPHFDEGEWELDGEEDREGFKLLTYARIAP